MRNYEIMFIVRPTLTEEEIKKVAKNFENVLTTNGANEIVINKAQSCQTMLLGLNSGGGDGSSPDLTEINKKIKALENKIESVQLEWEDLVKLTFE